MTSSSDVSMEVIEGLNDLENPGCISSSFSDCNDDENDSMLQQRLTYSHDRTRMTLDSDPESIYNALPPPPNADLFANNLIRQLSINNGINQQLPVPAQLTLKKFKESCLKALLKDMNAKQNAVLEKLEQRKDKQEELQELKESIAKHSEQIQKRRDELTSKKPKLEHKRKQTKEVLSTAESSFKNSEKNLKSKITGRDQAKAKFDYSKSYYERIKEEDQMLSNWTKHHCIKIDANDADKAENTTGSGSELMLQLIDSENPANEFYVILESIVPETGDFFVKSVYPNFANAQTVVNRANEQRDFLQLLKDCKSNWLQAASAEGTETV